MGILDILNSPQAKQFGGALQQLGQQDLARRQQEHMQKVFAANPTFAQQMYGAQNDLARLSIDQQRAQSGGQDPAALRELAAFERMTPEQKRIYWNIKRGQNPLDLGDKKVIRDPATGEIIQQYDVGLKPSDQPFVKGQQAEAAASGKIRGEDVATAQANYGALEATANNTMQTIDALLANEEGMNNATGVIQSQLPTVRQSTADFLADLDKVKGSAFLQAFQNLKGGGAITEIEGVKAENAIATLQTSQSAPKLRQALKDLKQIVSDGLERTKRKAGITQPSGNLDAKLKRLEELRALKARMQGGM